MTMDAVVRLVEDQRFEAVTGTGQRVVLHAPEDPETPRTGPSPMELALLATGGCTAVDVVGILRRMREDVTGLEVRLEAERAEEPPRVFTRVRMTYVVRGSGLRRDRVERAVRLSQERYCSVSIMLRRAGVAITTAVEVDGDG